MARRIIRAVGLAVMVTAMVSAAPVAADPIAATATVLKVVDGDTIDIRDDVRGRLRVRILGIDTPETKKPGYTVGCWGPEATAVRQIHHGGAASCARDRPDSGPDRPVWPHTGLPCPGRQMGLFGRGRSGRHRTLVRLWGPTCQPPRRDSDGRARSDGRPTRTVGAAMQRKHLVGSALRLGVLMPPKHPGRAMVRKMMTFVVTAIAATTIGVASPVATPADADSPDTEFLNSVRRSINNEGFRTLVDAAPTW